MRNPRTRGALAALTTVLLSGILLLSIADPAAAHDEFISSYPAANATVPDAPAELTLSFTGELNPDPATAAIEVLGPDGQNIVTEAPTISGTTLTQYVPTDAPAGTFTVRWKVVSSDAHPISGEFSYTVQPAPAALSTPTPGTTSEQTPEPSSTGTAATDNGDRGEPTGSGAFLPAAAIISGILVVGGVLLVVLLVARERRRRDRAAEAVTPAQRGGKR